MTDENRTAVEAAGKAAPTADELELIDDRLADAGKDDDALWAEIRAEQTGAEKIETRQDAASGHDETDDDADKTSDDASAREADIWANATPEQRAAFEAAQSARDLAEQRLRSDQGRQAALQRKIERLERQAQPRQRETSKTAVDLSSLSEDYPEIAEPLKKVLDPIATRMTKEDEDRTAAEEESRKAAESELSELVNEQTDILLEAYPDYDKFLEANAARFSEWVEDQPKRIREAAYRNAKYIRDGHGAIEVMKAFKAFIEPKPAETPAPSVAEPDNPIQLNDRRQRQLSATASPKSAAGRPTVSGIPKEGDPQAQWDAFRAQQRAQEARARA